MVVTTLRSFSLSSSMFGDYYKLQKSTLHMIHFIHFAYTSRMLQSI